MSARTDATTVRDAPWSEEAEQAVLGGLMLDNTAWDRIADLIDGRHFFAARHRDVFGAIGALISTGKPADVITVYEQLQSAGKAEDVGGLVYLNQLEQSVLSAANVRRYAEIVREKAADRTVQSTAEQACAIAGGVGVSQDKLARIVAMFDAVQRDGAKQGPREASTLVTSRVDHYTDVAHGNAPTGAATGFCDLDDALNGGLQEGRVYVVAARPSIGKSAFALQVGVRRALAGDGVLVLSQEMPAEEVIDRAVANLGTVDYGRMQRGQLTESDWRGVAEASDQLRQLPLWIDDQSGLTLRDIRAKAFGLRHQGLKVVVVDYLQLCTGLNPGRGSTRNGELEEITRGIKDLAKQLRIAVLLLSQLSRDVERRSNPEPTLADLRDSGAIEQDADVVLFLWFVRQFTDRKIMGLGIAKNRQGERGRRIALEFRGQHQHWSDSDADISPPRSPVHQGGFD